MRIGGKPVENRFALAIDFLLGHDIFHADAAVLANLAIREPAPHTSTVVFDDRNRIYRIRR